ncbi:MAG TPA: phosphatase PAP2 family protein [Candidatus Saccharimonadales bacterium]|nr:phosphatase PAP2 family protein [Candidatus Saccharimonadales bacterium]
MIRLLDPAADSNVGSLAHVSALVPASTLDLSGSIRSLSGHSGLLDGAMRFAAVYLIVAAALMMIPLWLRSDGLRAVVAAALGAFLAVALTAGIGMLWDRPRPFVAEHFTPLISHAADASFPSDHLAALGAVTICVWFASRRLGFMVGLIALVVAFARVYVGVHFVSDVVGGFALGLACGAVMWWATSHAQDVLERANTLLVRWHLRPASADAPRHSLAKVP